MNQALGRAASVTAAFLLVFALAMSNVGKAAAANLSRSDQTSPDVAAGWSVAEVHADVTGSALWPGSAPLVVDAEIVNRSDRSQTLRDVTASVASSEGDVIDDTTNAPIPGCRAEWFAARTSSATGVGAPDVSLPLPVPSRHTVVASIAVSMVESGSPQDACRGRHIRVSTSVR